MTAGNSIVMESLLDLDWHLCQHSSKDMQADDVRMFFIWQLEHGSAGWSSRPPMRQIEAYTRCASQRDWNGKSIARADSIPLHGENRYTGDPHRLLPEGPGVCAAHMEFGGRLVCIANPVLLFDIVSICLCVA
ncbi:unnamed protein product, partial [Symbiodinium pilosum]